MENWYIELQFIYEQYRLYNSSLFRWIRRKMIRKTFHISFSKINNSTDADQELFDICRGFNNFMIFAKTLITHETLKLWLFQILSFNLYFYPGLNYIYTFSL